MLLTHGGFLFSWQVTKRALTNNHTETLFSAGLPIRNHRGNYPPSYVSYLFGTFHIFI